jgi:DNA-binding transcriptional regulator/RsmH inhibitor MraZ
VVIIGMMDHFEIWDDDRWAIYQREQAGPFDDLRARLAEKGV